MAEQRPNDAPEFPEPILPRDSVLSREDYLEMQRLLGDPICFDTLRLLNHNGELSVVTVRRLLAERYADVDGVLGRLVAGGLVRHRDGPDGETVLLSPVGEAALERGIVDLMRSEHDILEQYQ